MSMERWPGGQQLYAARHRAELSAEDAAGVSVDTVGAVEVGTPVKSDVTAAMQGCASLLRGRALVYAAPVTDG
jgi:hypothetical protein